MTRLLKTELLKKQMIMFFVRLATTALPLVDLLALVVQENATQRRSQCSRV